MKGAHEWAAIGLARKLDGFSLERFVAEVQADARADVDPGVPSFRDYLAMSALAGLDCELHEAEHTAALAYALADAMLEARRKTEPAPPPAAAAAAAAPSVDDLDDIF